jgi:hypothetical protein
MLTGEFTQRAGITLRQAQWWDKLGLVRPQLIGGRGRGHRRRDWTEDDVVRACIIKRLRAVFGKLWMRNPPMLIAELLAAPLLLAAEPKPGRVTLKPLKPEENLCGLCQGHQRRINKTEVQPKKRYPESNLQRVLFSGPAGSPCRPFFLVG